MADELELLPDGATVFIAWAITEAAVTELVGQRVSLALSGTDPQIRCSVVSDAGGQYGEGQPQVLIECWGEGDGAVDDGKASLIARTVAASIHRLQGAYIESGPYASWDPTSSRPRWIVTARIFTFTDS